MVCAARVGFKIASARGARALDRPGIPWSNRYVAAGTAILALLVVAVTVAIVVRRVKLPYTVALVATGVALGAVRPLVPGLDVLFGIRLGPELLFAVLLPGLLYEAAFHISLSDLLRKWRTIALLAVPGVLLSSAITGLGVWAGLGAVGLSTPLLVTLLFGALICATDPISVLAMLKELGVSRRLRIAMEGESLLNDGLAVVVFAAVAGLLGLGHGGHEQVDATWIARLLLWEVGCGIAVGVGLGAVQSFVTSRVDDHLVEITMTTLVAFGSYLVADHLHASGVLAVVAAGLCSGNYGGRFGMSPTTRVAVVSLWEFVTFVANSMVFLLIGLEVDLVRLAGRAHLVLGAWVVVLAARAVAIWGLAPLLSRSREKLPPAWKPVLWWGGLHGALSMVLALSLPTGYVHRELLIDLTFGTVLLCILVQGLTLKPLLKRLGIGGMDPDRMAGELLRGRLLAGRAALAELERQHEEGRLDGQLNRSLRDELDQRIEATEQGIAELTSHRADQLRDEFVHTRRTLLMTERDALLHSNISGVICDDALNRLLAEVDERLDSLEEHGE